MKRPVLLIGFNRPSSTAKVMEAIERYRPTHLFVAVDGARSSHPDEQAAVDEVVAIATRSLPGCQTTTLLRPHNLGCRRAVSGAIDWFFEHVDTGIILEDDCVPSLEFFDFCDELLDRYEHDPRVGMIGGTNVLTEYSTGDSYHFGVGAVWGWATWATRWRHSSTHRWTPRQLFQTRAVRLVGLRRWLRLAESSRRTANGSVNTWDFPWVTSLVRVGACSAIPARNLVTNIGFDGTGTHTTTDGGIGSIPTLELGFPLRHPETVAFDRSFDRDWMRLESSLLKQWTVQVLNRLGLVDYVLSFKRRLRP